MRAFFGLMLGFSLLFSSAFITTEEKLPTLYNTKISPAFDKVKLQYFTTPDGLKIAYKIFQVPHAKANIVISSGRTESMVKYKELIYDLMHNGYSVYILDHRGQGFSSRMLKNPQIGHVDNFYHYVDDLKYFVDNFVPKKPKRILLAHSMGGAIASLYVEQYRDDFDALILSSPMHEPLVLREGITTRVCHALQEREKNLHEFIIGTAQSDILKTTFEQNDLTHSKVRFDIMQKEYAKNPKIRIGGMSKQWLREACKWSKESQDMATKITIPVLLFEAQNDTAVTSRGHKAFCRRVAKCSLVYVPAAYHELFIEKDTIRTEVLKEIVDFISSI